MTLVSSIHLHSSQSKLSSQSKSFLPHTLWSSGRPFSKTFPSKSLVCICCFVHYSLLYFTILTILHDPCSTSHNILNCQLISFLNILEKFKWFFCVSAGHTVYLWLFVLIKEGRCNSWIIQVSDVVGWPWWLLNIDIRKCMNSSQFI
jgi:hypothetical protein